MSTRQKVASRAFGAFVAAVLATWCVRTSAQTVKVPVDPGARGGAAGAGTPLQGLTADENAFFRDGLVRFADVEVVTGGNNNGLGPRFTGLDPPAKSVSNEKRILLYAATRQTLTQNIGQFKTRLRPSDRDW